MSASSQEQRGRSDLPSHDLWWLHDARWYQGVLKRYGKDAANEINREAVHFVCRRAAFWYTNKNGLDFKDMAMTEFVKYFEAIPRMMWPESMMNIRHEALGSDEWESTVDRNYALPMLRAAGSLQDYDCPCMAMRAGWFAGMGVKVRDERVACQRFEGDVCRFRGVRERSDDDTATTDVTECGAAGELSRRERHASNPSAPTRQS